MQMKHRPYANIRRGSTFGSSRTVGFPSIGRTMCVTGSRRRSSEALLSDTTPRDLLTNVKMLGLYLNSHSKEV